jgi:hypothetical protein
MIEERTIIRIMCDRKKCYGAANINESTRDEANRKLYDLGWRLCNGKQVCPHHIELRHKRLAREKKSC